MNAASVRSLCVAALVVAELLLRSAVADKVTELRIEHPLSWWQRHGYAGMVPSIHLPTTQDTDDLIHVWLRIPDGARIDATYLPEQHRWCLILPPGTRSDRTEYYRVRGPKTGHATHYVDSPLTDPADWTLADVRGTRVNRNGEQSFHVLRPTVPDPHAPVAGWAWRRGDVAAQRAATDRLLRHARNTSSRWVVAP